MATRAQVVGPRSRLFYVFAAVVIAAIIFAGFARTFYLHSYFAKSHLAPVLLVHGFVFTSWIVLWIVQTSLVAADRTDIHRRLGVFGGVLAALMIVVGKTDVQIAVSTNKNFPSASCASIRCYPASSG